jgi:hypothetical protein
MKKGKGTNLPWSKVSKVVAWGGGGATHPTKLKHSKATVPHSLLGPAHSHQGGKRKKFPWMDSLDN